MPSTNVFYRFRIRDQDDAADQLVITTVPGGTNPFLGKPPRGDGLGIDPITGMVSTGAMTVDIIDEVTDVEVEVLAGQNGLEYADLAALDAAGPETDTMGTRSTWSIEESILAPLTTGAKAIELRVQGTTGAGQDSYRTFVEGGFTPGATVRVRPWVWLNVEAAGSDGIGFGIEVVGGTSAYIEDDGPVGEYRLLTAEGVADGAGNITYRLGAFGSLAANYARLARFDDVRFYEVTGANSRVFTSHLTDSAGQLQLLSRRCYIERSADGASWDAEIGGFLTDYTLPRALVWSVTIGDSQRLDGKVELYGRLGAAAHPDVRYSGTYFVGGPIKGGFGPIPDNGGWRFRVRAVEAEFVEFEFLSGVVRPPAFVTGAQSVIGVEPTTAVRVTSMPQETRLRVNAQARAYMTQLAAPVGGSYMEFPGLLGEVVNPTDGSTVGFWTPYDSANAFGDPTWLLSVGGRARLRLAWTDDDVVAQPTVGAEFDVYVGPDEVSERAPFHVVGHPVDIALSGWMEARIPYDADAADDVRATLGAALKAHLRYTKGVKLGEALRESLFGPFGVSWRVNSVGDRVMFVARRMPITTPTVVITENELRAPGTAATGSERTVVNRVAWSFQRLFLWTQAEAAERPPDDIVEQKITYRLTNDDPAAPYGDREIAFAVPGALYNADDRFEPDLYSRELARIVFLLYGRGANEPELPVFAAGDQVQGEFVIVNAVHVPGASTAQTPTSQRGTARVMMVTKRTPVVPGADLRLLDVCDAALFPDPLTPPALPTPATIPPVTDLENAAGVDNTQRILTWTVGGATLPIEILLRLTADATSVLVIVLPPGSATYTLTGLTPGGAYTATVRHRELAPGIRVSADSTTSWTFDVEEPDFDPPTAPAVFAGNGLGVLDGTFGLEVTGAEFPSDTAFWVAVETGVGTGVYGSYAEAELVPTVVAPGRTRFTGVAPNDGLWRSIEARHERGDLVSDFTTPLDVDPWGDPVAPPAPGVLGQTGDSRTVWAGANSTLKVTETPALATEVDEAWRTPKDLTGRHYVARFDARVAVAGPLGSRLMLRGSINNGADFQALDLDAGPSIPLDVATPDRQSVSVAIDASLLGGIRLLSPHIVGGDDATPCALAFVGWEITEGALAAAPPTGGGNEPVVCPHAEDGFEYITLADLEMAWPETDTLGAVSTWFIETSVVTEGNFSAALTVIGAASLGQASTRTRTFGGFTPGAAVLVELDLWINYEQSGSSGLAFGVEIVGGGGAYIEADGDVNDWTALSVAGVADGSGNVPVRIGAFHASALTHDRLARFDNLRVTQTSDCTGSDPAEPGVPGVDPGDFDVDGFTPIADLFRQADTANLQPEQGFRVDTRTLPVTVAAGTARATYTPGPRVADFSYSETPVRYEKNIEASGFTELKVRYRLTLSPDFDLHPTGTNKIMFARDENGATFFLSVEGVGSGDGTLTARLQGPAEVNGESLPPNLGGAGAGVMARGVEHEIWLHLKQSSTPSASDGQINMWLNGDAILGEAAIQWLCADPVWRAIMWELIDGGGGAAPDIPADMFLECHQFTVWGKV